MPSDFDKPTLGNIFSGAGPSVESDLISRLTRLGNARKTKNRTQEIEAFLSFIVVNAYALGKVENTTGFYLRKAEAAMMVGENIYLANCKDVVPLALFALSVPAVFNHVIENLVKRLRTVEPEKRQAVVNTMREDYKNREDLDYWINAIMAPDTIAPARPQRRTPEELKRIMRVIKNPGRHNNG